MVESEIENYAADEKSEHPPFQTNIFDEREEPEPEPERIERMERQQEQEPFDAHHWFWLSIVIIIFCFGVAASYYLIHYI